MTDQGDLFDQPPELKAGLRLVLGDKANDFVKTHTHAGGVETESEPAISVESTAASQKREILALLAEAGADGMPPYRLSQAIGVDNSQESGSPIRRRIYDLRNEGKVRQHPERRTEINDNGRPCLCWVLGDDPDKRKKPSLPDGLEWQAILDALLFTEKECLVSDAHFRARSKVEALIK